MAIVTNGLVGYWNRNQGLSGTTWQNIAPTTQGQYDATLLGGASIQADGLYLNGTDGRVQIPTPAGFQSNNDQAFTIEVCVNLARLPSSSMESSYIFGSDTSHAISVGNTGGLGSYFSYSLSNAAGITTGTTIYVSFIYNTSDYSQKLYFNGTQVASTSSTSVTSFATINKFFLGHDLSGFYPYYTKGTYKFARIYNRALTGAEITQNYQTGEVIGLPLPTYTMSFTDSITLSDSISTRKNTKVVNLSDSISLSDTKSIVHEMGLPWYLNAMNAKAYWDKGLTGKGIKVGVVDTGIGYHTGLTVAGGYDFFPNNKDYRRDDSGLGHGTKVASLLGGKLTPYYSNGELQGYAGGIAPDVTLYSLKVEDLSGGLAQRIHSAIDWAVENDLDILNLSLAYSSDNPPIEQSYYDKLKSNGILIVAGAGNYDEEITPTMGDPLARSLVDPVVVTGLNSSMARSTFSYGSTVDFIAPARDMTTFAYSNTTPSSGVVLYDWGTSFATPLVSGVFAIYKQAFPNKTWDEIYTYIQNSTRKIDGQTGWDKYRGYGLPQPSPEILGLTSVPVSKTISLMDSVSVTDSKSISGHGLTYIQTLTERITLADSTALAGTLPAAIKGTISLNGEIELNVSLSGGIDMTVLNQNFTIVEGDSKNINIRVKNTQGNALTGSSVKWVLKQSVGSAINILLKSTPTQVTVNNDTVTISLLPNDTKGLEGFYYHECELTDPQGSVATLTTGSMTILKSGV